MRKVLISGASGMVGSALAKHLTEKGHQVNALYRSGTIEKIPGVHYYLWDVQNGYIDVACLQGVDTIVHLAGTNIANLPWSNKVKASIVSSRTESISLIYDAIKKEKNQSIKHVISASATGYYNHRGNELMTESKKASLDFLGLACTAWENAVNKGSKLGLRTVILRSGLVLDSEEGALPKLAATAKLGLAAALGSGQQWTPWIHIADAIGIYSYAIEHEDMQGIYNMVAPQPIRNEQLIRAIAQRLDKPYWLPNVPAFLIRAVLGQMSQLLLSSTKVSAQKISRRGYQFQYPKIDQALRHLY